MTAILITFLNCCTSTQMLPEPMNNKNLLIGSLILNIDGYQDNMVTIRGNIEVAIIGQFVKEGTFHRFGQWTITDENGYFYIPNVPDGEYAIKGFRTRLIGIGNLTIENELIDPENNYYELKDTDIISMSGNLFDIQSNLRIVNFKHNIFTLYRSGMIGHDRYDRIQDFKLSMGEVINIPPVPIHFLEKFEGSGWESYLNLQLK